MNSSIAMKISEIFYHLLTSLGYGDRDYILITFGPSGKDVIQSIPNDEVMFVLEQVLESYKKERS